jgi:acetylornithine deacetylase/succinyl-diaminopimelate desuccinylase-like protein
MSTLARDISTQPSLLDELTGHLRRCIQIDTTNPPGNELALARYLDTVLSTAEIETHLFEPVKGRAALVARLRGSGAAAPVLMAAHMDVVDVERDQWRHDPFGGEIDGDHLYGRGAIDDKGMLATNLVTMLRLKRELDASGRVLDRDVVFVATSDEEMGGSIGLEWLLEHQSALVAAEFALNEGGRIRVVNGKPLYAAVQTTEKASHVVTITAHGTSGHASVPAAESAVTRLIRGLARVAEHHEPIRLLPTTKTFFSMLADVWPDSTVSAAMSDLGSDRIQNVERACSALCSQPMFNAVLRTTIAPTILDAGTRHNVIPGEASATLSVRTLPGDRIDDVLGRLRALIDDPAVDVTLISTGLDAPVSDDASPMFRAIRASVTALDPRIVTVPYMSTGATESALLRAAGVKTYGLLPFPLDADDEARMHGHDERVPLDSLLFGAHLVFDIINRMASGDGRVSLV